MSNVVGVEPGELDRIAVELDELLRYMRDAERRWAPWITAVAPEHRPGAVNLAHYWAIRQLDLRDLQGRLARLGLSSLGRSEAHVQATLHAVALAVGALRGMRWQPSSVPPVDFGDGQRLLERHANELLGPADADGARVMVTLPSESAGDAAMMSRLVEKGMKIARINCAHDDHTAWRAMAVNVRAAADALGRRCLIAMDLGGPKLRTGPLEPGPKVLRLRPARDAAGRVLTPARGWLTSAGAPAAPPMAGTAVLPVPGGWLRGLQTGDLVELRDARDSHRWLEVHEVATGGVTVVCDQTVYLATGTVLTVVGTGATAAVGDLPAVEQALRLRAGDMLRVSRDLTPAPIGVTPPRIGCTLPEVFDTIEVGHRVFLDDGKIGGQVVAIASGTFDLRIDHPAAGTAKLRAAKGINVPDTDLPISALTEKDLVDLETVADLADIVQLSFVREPSDVAALLAALDRLADARLGIVLKVETATAFENLPQLMLMAMRRPGAGVMIARGDLAVECGFERMAEVQEEMLWLCEAAHLPVIWATQVLDQMARTGVPSRAEISDAALADRAECVMLNKGPYIEDAVGALRDILARMAGHHHKKIALLRPLQSWRSSDAPVTTSPA